MTRIGANRSARQWLAAHDECHQSPLLDFFPFLVDQLPVPRNMAMPTAMGFQIDHLGDGINRIPWENRFTKVPVLNVDQCGRLHRRCSGTEPHKNRHPQHAMNHRLSKRPSSCKLLVDVQTIVISGQRSELQNVGLQDGARVALPTISNMQLLETQAVCVGDHCFPVFTNLL